MILTKLLPITRPVFAASLLTVSMVQAQLGGLVFEFEAEEPEYKVEAASTNFSAFLTQLNTEGAAGYRRSGPRVFFSGSTIVNRELYVRDLLNPSTYQYQFDIVETSPTPFLAQLNEHGAEGFAFAGLYRVPNTVAEQSLYENDTSENATYEYQLVGVGSASTNIADLNTAGINGWQWIGPYVFGNELLDLCVREVGTAATFSYTTEASLDGENATLAQLNEEGAEGRRWRGSFLTSTESEALNIFEKKTPSTKTYTYRSRAQESSEQGFLNAANEEGEAGFYYRGPFFFTNPSGSIFRDFYASVSDETSSGGGTIGVITFQSPEEITFSPSEAGEYQLQISRTLNDDWVNLGNPQTSSGEALIFAITFQPDRCFFQIEQTN